MLLTCMRVITVKGAICHNEVPCSLGLGVRTGEPWNTISAVQTRAWFLVVRRMVAASRRARRAAAARGLALSGLGSATTRMPSADPLHSGCTPPWLTPRAASCTRTPHVTHYTLHVHVSIDLSPSYAKQKSPPRSANRRDPRPF